MVEFCLGKEKVKNLCEQGRNQGTTGEGKLHFWSENESPINCVHEKISFTDI